VIQPCEDALLPCQESLRPRNDEGSRFQQHDMTTLPDITAGVIVGLYNQKQKSEKKVRVPFQHCISHTIAKTSSLTSIFGGHHLGAVCFHILHEVVKR